jgi:hypothetical protein
MADIMLKRMPPVLKGGPRNYHVWLKGNFGSPLHSAREAMTLYNTYVEQGHTLSQDEFVFEAFGDQNAALQAFMEDAAAEAAAEQAEPE